MRVCRSLFLPVLTLALAAPRLLQAGSDVGAVRAQSAQEVEDIGVIDEPEVEAPEPAKFRASVASRAEFTTNALLTGNHSENDVIFFPEIQVGYNVPLRHNFTFDIGAKLDSGIYSQNNQRSYIGYNVVTTLDWRPKFNAPRIYIGAEPYRYDNFDSGDMITQAVGLSIGSDWGVSFNKGYSMVFVGYSFTDYLADPDIDNRGMHKAIVGLTHEFTPRLYSTLFYQFAYSDFQNVNRNDTRHIVGGNLTYQFSKTVFGSLVGSFVDNDSTQDLASYQGVSVSLGVNVQF